MTSPDASAPSRSDWEALYRAADRIAEMKPWTWMEETEVFGVEKPEPGEVDFVSVTGTLGEHLSVTLYLGTRALYDFFEIQHDDADRIPAERVLEIPQLQASFEDRVRLEPRDFEIIKALGLGYRGARGWPMFRSYRPGFFPWFLETTEARILTHALEQLADVAPRFKEDETVIFVGGDREFLLRSARREEGALVWADKVMQVAPPPPRHVTVALSARDLAPLSRMRGDGEAIEADFFFMPVTIGPKTDRPRYTYFLVLVGARSGMIVGHEILMAEPSLEAMWGSLAAHVARHLAVAKTLPAEIRVRSSLFFDLLRPLTKEAGIKVRLTEQLDGVDEARASFEAMLARR